MTGNTGPADAATSAGRSCPRCSSTNTVSGPPNTWNHCSGCGRYWDIREEEE